jgi:hypothetical protein
MLTAKQYQEGVQHGAVGVQERSAGPALGRAQSLLTGSGGYCAWNEGWPYASNFYVLKAKADAHRGQVDRGTAERFAVALISVLRSRKGPGSMNRCSVGVQELNCDGTGQRCWRRGHPVAGTIVSGSRIVRSWDMLLFSLRSDAVANLCKAPEAGPETDPQLPSRPGRFSRTHRYRRARRGGCRGFDVAAMAVVGVAGEPSSGFARHLIAGEDRHAIPGFLAVPDSTVPGTLNLAAGKPLVRRLQFLQTDDIRLCLGKPAQ